MEFKVYNEKNFNISKWSGGSTTQFAIYPETAQYQEKDFIFRLCSATVNVEDSSFAKLADYERILMVLEGDVVLAHKGKRMAHLKPFDQDSFDCSWDTDSKGEMVDYNLMVRKGNYAYLNKVDLQAENTKLELHDSHGKPCQSQGIYMVQGMAFINIGDETISIKEGEQFLLDSKEDVEIFIMGEGIAIHSEVYYDFESGLNQATYIPPEKGTFQDWKECVYLANSQFRGAKFFFPRKKKEWLDEALSGKIRKLEKVCANYIVFVIGLLVVIGVTHSFGNDTVMIISSLVWLIIDILLVSPTIYFIFLPKPIKKHIKKIEDLTPYEEKIRKEEQYYSDAAKRYMKHYEKNKRVQANNEARKRG
ncbi:MAG: HutD family protein [Clostridia bacterium]|nr:HutD family protein [Clostridia bacterium]